MILPSQSAAPDLLRVRVWFGTHLLHDHRAEPTAARNYAEAIGRRFAGLRVTVDADTAAGPGGPDRKA